MDIYIIFMKYCFEQQVKFIHCKISPELGIFSLELLFYFKLVLTGSFALRAWWYRCASMVNFITHFLLLINYVFIIIFIKCVISS